MADPKLPDGRKALSQVVALKIWDVMRECGAHSSNYAATSHFCYAQSERFTTEYRFLGNLGFGGKFWRNNDKWYVSCYSEDETPERKSIIEKTNKALAELKAKTEDSHV